jgi:hypothetical protein
MFMLAEIVEVTEGSVAQRFLRSSKEVASKKREILLIGDSLVQVADSMFKMATLLKEDITLMLPKSKRHLFDIDVQIIGGSSLKIAELYDLVNEKLTSRREDNDNMPYAVIIYSDSDMSDGGWNGVPISYKTDLKRLIEMLKKQVRHVAVVGPSLHTKAGEQPDHWKTDNCVLEFIEANMEVSKSMGVHYINTRKAFQSAIIDEIKNNGAQPKTITEFSWDELKRSGIDAVKDKIGILTFDGSHTNERGTKVLVNHLAREIVRWKDLWWVDSVPGPDKNSFSDS